jgi:hypothetical protein
VSFGLLWLLTSTLDARGLSAVRINLVLSVPMTLLGFLTTWLLVFGDRQVTARSGLSRWIAKALFMGALGQGSFALLVGMLGMQHMLVAASLIVVKAPLAYTINHEWVFPEESSTGRSNPA